MTVALFLHNASEKEGLVVYASFNKLCHFAFKKMFVYVLLTESLVVSSNNGKESYTCCRGSGFGIQSF